VLLHPDDGSVESWKTNGSGDKVRADFADFEPRYASDHTSGKDDIILSVSCHSQHQEATQFCQIDAQVASYGSRAIAYLGTSERSRGALGRRLQSDARKSEMIVVELHTCSSLPLNFLDRSHTQPYLAQGAAIAVEDAAVLGAVLSHVSSFSQLYPLLHAYQNLRYVHAHIILSRTT
jgi:salicylate hydroxylase